ncbi:hypothetical protein FG386_000849 [Cryptosporidium ryanae]|uniref:uncharacterized protein n=1 Tax=Cryptosporidium ryanae TaxID=515981 RepID=UPI00351A0ACA|nr:hypothetical protein FG386_000849 [Cryptosporidium ryanae]
MVLIKDSYNSDDLDKTLSRIKGKKGVLGVIILASEKYTPLITTFDKKTTQRYSEYVHSLINTADLLGGRGNSGVQLIRLYYNNQIVLLAPDKGYVFIVIQETNL